MEGFLRRLYFDQLPSVGFDLLGRLSGELGAKRYFARQDSSVVVGTRPTGIYGLKGLKNRDRLFGIKLWDTRLTGRT